MEKKTKITKKVQRQLDILSKYYEIDTEKGVIKIELQYEKASDLFETDLVTKGTPKFKTEILARISDLLESVPTELKVDFSIKVLDYEGMKIDNIVESFKDQLEVFNFEIYKEKSGRLLAAVILTSRFFPISTRTRTGNGWRRASGLTPIRKRTRPLTSTIALKLTAARAARRKGDLLCGSLLRSARPRWHTPRDI